MSKLFVIGNCYAESGDYGNELFQVLEDAGYQLAYNTKSQTSCTILKELDIPEENSGNETNE